MTAASPVSGGMGMALLQKMGWRPGEGLGKNKEGTLEPLKLEIKTDKKGEELHLLNYLTQAVLRTVAYYESIITLTSVRQVEPP